MANHHHHYHRRHRHLHTFFSFLLFLLSSVCLSIFPSKSPCAIVVLVVCFAQCKSSCIRYTHSYRCSRVFHLTCFSLECFFYFWQISQRVTLLFILLPATQRPQTCISYALFRAPLNMERPRSSLH